MASMKLIHSPLSAAALLMAAVLFISTINDSLLFADAAGEPGTAGLFLSRNAGNKCRGLKGQGKLTAAADVRVFSNGQACGQRFEVTCAGAGCKKRNIKVVVVIVDTCVPIKGSPCQTLSLSRDAFASITNRNGGAVSITFKQLK